MKTILISLCLSLFSFLDITAQTDFVLEPSQSMIMTGKGAGQDATINPYYGQDCYALIQNIGKRKFSVRIQKDGEIINLKKRAQTSVVTLRAVLGRIE